MDDDELSRLTAENSALQRKLFDQEIEQAEGNTKRAVIDEATKRNLDPEACYKLVDLGQIDQEDPKSVKRALDNLVKDRPWLTGRTGPPPTPGPGGPPLKTKPSTDQMFAAMLRRGVGRAKGKF